MSTRARAFAAGVSRWLLPALFACSVTKPEAPAGEAAPSLAALRPAPRASTGFRAQVPAEWRFDLQAAPTRAQRYLVDSDSELASRAGLAVLAAGGNAVDAAVSVAFVLAVVYPEAGNLGGGGFALVRAGDGTRAALDFRETAPAAAERDMFQDAQGAPRRLSAAGPADPRRGGAALGN